MLPFHILVYRSVVGAYKSIHLEISLQGLKSMLVKGNGLVSMEQKGGNRFQDV
jgi:hypothetical protein